MMSKNDGNVFRILFIIFLHPKEKEMNLLKYKIMNSPIGSLKIVIRENKLIAILWDVEKPNRVRLDKMVEDNHDSLILETEKQLNEYFRHQRTEFKLPLEMIGTMFQRSVWELLNQIPYGSTLSYMDIAIKLNKHLAVRAVGTAVGKNPISIIVPCHRVIGSNGSLTGFAGGIDRKRLLLDLESQS
jgi:methylated-DNA-[protein]-cysteine S-methyltransferase